MAKVNREDLKFIRTTPSRLPDPYSPPDR
jgi:hypothetical protein